MAETLKLNKKDYLEPGQFTMRGFASHNPIGKDLEEHARQQTVNRLNEQANTYKDFNERVIYLLEPELQKENL